MSLVTRCPTCNTLFKVVADQLKVSQGWVRCGQCSDVFDAQLHLQPAEPVVEPDFSPDRGSPSSVPPPVRVPVHSTRETASEYTSEAASEDTSEGTASPVVIAPEPVTESDSAINLVPEPEAVRDPNASAYVLSRPAASDAVAPSADETVEAAVTQPSSSSTWPAEMGSSAADSTAAPFEVTFVRQARRKAWWKTSSVQVSFAMLAALLLVVLGVQWLVFHRNSLSLLEPRLVPAIEAVCALSGCEVKPLRRAEALVIDSSTFTKIGTDSFRLGFVLKNTDSLPLEVPSLELTLNDSDDKPVVRRVLQGPQFGVLAGVVPGRSEVFGSVDLRVAPVATLEAGVPSRQVAGYRVLVFYP